MNRLVTLAFASTLAACVSTAPPPSKAASNPITAKGSGADAGRTAVREIVQRQTAAIAAGDVDGWLAWHADDVLWIGTDADEVLVGKANVSRAMHGFFDPVAKKGGHFEAAVSDRALGATDDGRAVWVSESFALRVASETPMTIPFRHTAMFAEDRGEYRVLAEAWTVALPRDEIVAKAASRQWRALVDLGDAVGRGAEPIAAAFGRDLSRDALAALVSDRSDAAFVGAAADETFAAGAHARAAIEERGMSLRRHGSVRAALAPSGRAGWVMLNVDATLTDSKGASAVAPLRAFAVLIDEGGAWRVVLAHFSIGS